MKIVQLAQYYRYSLLKLLAITKVKLCGHNNRPQIDDCKSLSEKEKVVNGQLNMNIWNLLIIPEVSPYFLSFYVL
jgi:hypothetical protein